MICFIQTCKLISTLSKPALKVVVKAPKIVQLISIRGVDGGDRDLCGACDRVASPIDDPARRENDGGASIALDPAALIGVEGLWRCRGQTSDGVKKNSRPDEKPCWLLLDVPLSYPAALMGPS